MLREPTVHFILLAALLFAAGAIAKSERREIIEIDRRAVERRIHEVERGRGALLTADERKLTEAAYIDEHVLAREARIRGFDDDERIRSILSQKMLHILSGGITQPTDLELRTYFEERRARYARPPAVTVEEAIGVNGESGAPTGGPGHFKRTVLQRVSSDELSWTFGAATAALVFGGATGKWVGPHHSVQGEHWFRVIERFDASQPPPFESIRDQIRFDWIAEKDELLLKQRVAALRERYSVTISEDRSSP